MVFAVREPSDQRELVGLPDLPLSGLLEADPRALLATVVPGRLDEFIRDRIIAETHGNPLALLELPRGMSVTELSGGFALPDTGDLPSHIEEHFRRRLASLPESTRRLMLVAAADPVGDATLVWRAARALGIETEAGAPAATGQLLEIAARVRFPPSPRTVSGLPLVVGGGSTGDSQHAGGGNRRRDRSRSASLASRQATSGPDEEVAAELEHSAGRAQAGDLAAAAAFPGALGEPDLRSGAPRGEDVGGGAVQRPGRHLSATLGLLAAAESGPLDDFGHARVDLLRAQVALASRRGNEATPLLLAAARRLEHLDLDLARGTFVDAFAAAHFGGRLNDRVDVPDVARAAHAVPRRIRRRADGCRSAAGRVPRSARTTTRRFRSAGTRCSRIYFSDATSPAENLRWLWHATVIALELWDDEKSFVASHDHLEIARRTGALSELWVTLSSRTPSRAAATSRALPRWSPKHSRYQRRQGISGAPYGGLILAAWRGRAHGSDGTHRGHDPRGELSRRGNRNRHQVGIAAPCFAMAAGSTKRPSWPPVAPPMIESSSSRTGPCPS